MPKSTVAERKAWNKSKKDYISKRERWGCKVNKKWFIQLLAGYKGRLARSTEAGKHGHLTMVRGRV